MSHRSYRAIENEIAHGHIRREASCTHKKAYSAGEAERARQGMGRQGKSTSIYHCRFCNKYHLTHACE